MECSWDEIEAEQRADEEAKARGETVPERPPWRRPNPANSFLADIEEDNAYVETCPRGHQMKMLLQNVRYELLYESGIVAMLVGFQREAVSSFASAMERFYEFAVEVFTLRAGIAEATYDTAWKSVKNRSEIQWGAFLFLHLVNFGKPFEAANEKMANFRNGVIHQGRFPSAADTEKYARYVFELIRDTRAALKGLDANAVQQIEFRHLRDSHAAVWKKAGEPKPDKNGMYQGATTSSHPTMLAPLIADAPMDFDSRLAATKANLGIWGFPPQT